MIQSTHGGNIYNNDNILYDFSANVNPLGVPESVKKAVSDNLSCIEKYPDINCTELKKSISLFENVPVDNIVCGNGASDLIFRTVQAIHPKKALLISPTFSEYEKALHTVGCHINYFSLEKSNGFTITEAIVEHLTDTDIFFLCNPNNPVGNLIDKPLLHQIIRKCHQNHTILIVDECFLDFVKDSYQYKCDTDYDNVIILKAFTKIFAMAGLRLGYILCKDRNLCTAIENTGQCWSVSTIAQLAGVYALKEKDFIHKSVEYVEKQRNFLIRNLQKYNFCVFPPSANFIFFQCDLPMDTLLLQHGILIRNCNNYRNLSDGYFRIAVRTEKENQFFIHTLERTIRQWQNQL